MKRILTALVGIPILLFAIWADSPYYFSALAAVAMMLGLGEVYGMAERLGYHPERLAGYAAALGTHICFFYGRLELIAAVVALLALVSLSMAVARPNAIETSLASVSSTALGVIYVALLIGFLIGVRMIPETLTTPAIPRLPAKLLTMFFAMVMMTDTGAYYTGRAIGRHKLAPKISPGKTIEGSIGGFATAAITGLLCKLIFFPELPLTHAVILGAVIGVVGQMGDLAESLLKRGAGVKDSGRLFPGHGGMLDRLDSILFCAPIVYYYSTLFLPR